MNRVDAVGVDVGGTFTDFVIREKNGTITVRKYASTPQDASLSVLRGLAAVKQEGILMSDFLLIHGTTVATNALLERRGARTALITTRGFRDVLEIGRQTREHLYALHPTKTEPLLDSAYRREVTERIDWQGQVVVPLDLPEAELLLDQIVREGFESVAICLLFSYLNSNHEQQLGRLARSRGVYVSLSSEIAPEPREFERTATVVANAYVMPVMTRYLERMAAGLETVGAGRLRIMQSDGGALSASEAAQRAVKTALSGPAAGVVAAAQCGRAVGAQRLLTFDMGGTSTDVALVVEGEYAVVTTGRVAGIPLRTPMMDIHTVGAGGGSLAFVDAAGGLRVGPRSAGADPGPVAYGRGEILTVTDANLMLGRLPADVRLAGSVPLDRERVEAVFENFARALGVDVEQAAQGIIDVANASMARALRHISVERGHDPAYFTLLSFGGAGALHACALAESLGMRSVLIPRFPGAFSALGLTMADVRREYSRGVPAGKVNWTAEGESEFIAQALTQLETRATKDMAGEGYGHGEWSAHAILDLRYTGQSSELRVPLHNRSDLSAAVAAFHEAHRVRYGHADVRELVELAGVRLLAVAQSEAFQLPLESGVSAEKTRVTTRLFAAGAWHWAQVVDRAALAVGQSLRGPAVVLQPDATLYIAPAWESTVDELGNLRLYLLP